MIEPLILSLQVAAITTVLLAAVGIPLSWRLANRHSIAWRVVEALTSLPLVLPSTVIGFYLLLAFAPNSALGQWLISTFDWQLAFSFGGLVIASLVYSLPFMIQPLVMGFRSLDAEQVQAASLMGVSPRKMLWRFAVPATKPYLMRASILCFVHTLGEFGAILMIGGNIPGQTQTLSIALYEKVELLQFSEAHPIALTLITFSLVALLVGHPHIREVRHAQR